VAVASAAAGQEQDEPTSFPVAATVNGEPIYVSQVENLVNTLRRTRNIEPAQMNQARAEALQQAIERRLMTIALRRDGKYVSESEIDKELDKFRTQASARGMSLERFLNRNQLTSDAVRYEVAWTLGSKKYLDQHLGEALESYFNEHHAEFDGTQMRAAHILLRPGRFSEPPSQVAQRAKALRDAIESGKLSFEDAVKQYSVGPSRAAGGDVGYFPRHGVMQEEFAKAAFALKPGQLSQPVLTPFGVHLIRGGDSKPGNKQWTEAVELLKGPASLDLYAKLLEKEQADAKIEFTGLCPYLKPGSKELVIPGKPATP